MKNALAPVAALLIGVSILLAGQGLPGTLSHVYEEEIKHIAEEYLAESFAAEINLSERAPRATP